MGQKLRTVALVCANPALGSILSASLAGNRHLRVRSFETCIALAFYARIAPVDIVIADLDDGMFDIEIVDACECGGRAPVIGLARSAGPVEGIAEVIAKPVSPDRLLGRTLFWLDQRGKDAAPALRPTNVVQLFRNRHEPSPSL